MNSLRRRTDSEFRSVQADHTKIWTNKTQYLESDMAGRDRTVEFQTVVRNKEERLRDKLPVRGKQHMKNPSKREWTSFMRTANQIGRDIASTYGKLEKLTVLAKRKSLFDKPVEIEELTYVIKQDINSLNKQIAQLQESKNSTSSNHGKHMLHHSNSIVVSLQSKLANMSSNFRDVLEVRTENLKHEKIRRDTYSGSTGTTTGTLPSAISGESRSVLLLCDEKSENSQNYKDECAINMDGRYQQQLQLIDEEDAYIQNRADTMQNIEATIVELGTIFQQLAHMVKEQEEIVQRIDANVEMSEMNIESAYSEILKYFQNVSSNRWLMIKVFAVLIVFFLIFVIFVA